ncbi:hypothetical protein R4514_18725, partial [Acinetobacter baumannii]|nr:hypothetical protein [Acinetobacter baumannii]
ALYNNTAGWYTASLNTLENNKLYDYQYLAYNAKGDILGGGQGVINTVLNQATIIQKALTVTDLPSIYVDKKEIVNTRQDVVKGEYLAESTVIYPTLNMPARLTERLSTLKLKYSFDNNLLNNYYGNDFTFIFEDNEGRGIKKYINFSKNLVGANTEVYIDLTSQELGEIAPMKYQGSGGSSYGEYKVTLAQVINNNFSPVATSVQKIYTSHMVIGGEDRYNVSFGSSTEEGLVFKKINQIKIIDQPVNTNQIIFYYRELDSNKPYNILGAFPLRNIYDEIIPGVFSLNPPSAFDPLKKYEFKYISVIGEGLDVRNIINYQQGIIEFTNAGMQVNVSPLNYGGDGFILFGGTSVYFIDQFNKYNTKTTTAQLKMRKVGTIEWEIVPLNGKYNWFSWSGGNRVDGDYEFELDSINQPLETVPVGRIIGKLRLGSQPQVLSYIPSSFVQNQITFAGQPTGSSKVTVKYGTAAGLLNKTAVLTVGSDGKAILDATDLAEQNLLGTTT